jgi:uncharacterized protein (TIGR00730 family)
MASICVFCGSQCGTDTAFGDAATGLGRYLAENGHTTVFGGGSLGLMGALADAVLEGDGAITGAIPRHLARVEIMHTGVRDMRITEDMHERKALMHSLADCYVALPGGFGTMEELFEAVTWAQLDLHASPIVVLNVSGIYDGLVQLIEDMDSSRFLSSDSSKLVNVVNSEPELFNWISHRFPGCRASHTRDV